GAQLAAIADLSKRLGNGAVDITTRQQIELRGYTIESVPEIFERLRGVDLRTLQTGQDNVRNINGCPLAGLTPTEVLDASPIVYALDQSIVGTDGNPKRLALHQFENQETGVDGLLQIVDGRDVRMIEGGQNFSF